MISVLIYESGVEKFVQHLFYHIMSWDQRFSEILGLELS